MKNKNNDKNQNLQRKIKQLEKQVHDLQSQIENTKKEQFENSGFYQTLFQFSPIGIIIEDKHGTIMDVNPAWCKLTGYNRKEIIGEHISKVAHPDNHEKIDKHIEQLLSGKKLKHLVKSIKKDGTQCYIQINERVIKLPDGEPRILCIVQDMTKEEESRKALSEYEERLNIILDSTGLGWWDMDFKQPRVSRDENWAKMLGYKLNEIDNNIEFWANSIHPDDQDIAKKIARDHESGKIKRFEVEHRMKTKDGQWKWIYNWGKIIERDQKGKPVRAVGTHLDITKRKIAEEKLKLSEERYKNLFEFSPDPIVILSSGKIVSLNKAAVQFFEVTNEKKLLGKSLDNFRQSDDQLFSSDKLLKNVRGRTPIFSGETRFVTAKKKVMDVELSVVPFFNEDIQSLMVVFRDVTEKKIFLDKLKESENSYRGLFNNATDAIYVLDQKGRFLDVNEGVPKMYGYPKEFYIGKTPKPLSAPGKNDMKQVVSYIKMAFEGTPQKFEFWGKHKSGKIFPKIVRLNKGTYFGRDVIFAFALDITEQKENEKLIYESRERFRALVETTVDWIWEVDAKMKFSYSSPTIQSILGYSADEIIGKSFFDFIPPQEVHIIKKKIQTCSEKKLPFSNMEISMFHKNSNIVILERSAVPILDEQKKFAGFRGIDRNITERKIAETQIKRLATVVEQAVESIMITDLNGTIIYVNNAFEKLTGFKKSEALGKNPNILKSGKHGVEFYSDLWSTILSGNKWQGTIINKRKNGNLFYQKAAIFPVKDENGEIINYSSIMRDITLERKLEQQLQQIQKMEAIGTLSGGIAHDFNNILTVINGHAEMAMMNMKGNNAYYDDFQSILNAGKRAEKLTNQLLAFSRKQVHELYVIDINQTIKDLEKMLRRLIPEDINIVSIYTERLPYIKADPGQIEQILINLIINARDALSDFPKAQKEKKIIIKTELVELDTDFVETHPGSNPGPHILLTVDDSGKGMNSEVKGRVFEPFFTTKDVDKGTGLGLSTVYGIVKQNDGCIYVESAPRRGTSFRIYWPVTSELPDTDYIEIMNQKRLIGTETILFVEDDLEIKNLASQALQNFGYQVIVAENGEAALRLAKETKDTISIIITDVIMPKMNGRVLEKHIRKLYPEIKILFVSGYTFDHLLKDHELTEDINYLQKPYTIQNMLKKIRDILDN